MVSILSSTVAKVRPASLLRSGAGVIKLTTIKIISADDEHQDAVVEKVHADEPAEEAGLIVRGFIEHFKNESHRTHHESCEQRRDRSGSVEARPQNSEDEADGDRRADVSLHALQVNPELRAEHVNERNPEQAEQHHHAGRDAAEVDELFLGRGRTEFFVEVERDHRGSGVEDRTHRAHQRGKQSGDHQSDEAGGEQIDDRGGKRDVAVGNRAIFDVKELWIKRERDHAGNHEQEHGENFQESREDRAGFCVAFIFGGEHALHDDLVGAPIPDADNRRAEENSGPRKIGIG